MRTDDVLWRNLVEGQATVLVGEETELLLVPLAPRRDRTAQGPCACQRCASNEWAPLVVRDVEPPWASPGAPDARPRARLTCRQASELIQRSRVACRFAALVAIARTPALRPRRSPDAVAVRRPPCDASHRRTPVLNRGAPIDGSQLHSPCADQYATGVVEPAALSPGPCPARKPPAVGLGAGLLRRAVGSARASVSGSRFCFSERTCGRSAFRSPTAHCSPWR